MKLKNVALFAALIGLPIVATAQNNENLVDNGGFESTTGKIRKLGQIDLATGWKSPTGNRADVFLSDSKEPTIGAPTNAFGTEGPNEGENYAGINAFSFGNKMPRSYISTKLKTPLKKDVKYCVSFYVNLAEASKYSCNQIGMNINKKEFGTDQKTSIIDEAQIKLEDNKVINAFFGWQQICGTFTAEGGEKYITIGNFNADADTKSETNKKPKDFKGTQIIGAYYYVDNVVVKMLNEGEVCECNSGDKAPTESSVIYMKQVQNSDRLSPKERIQAQGLYFAYSKDRLTDQGNAALDLIAKELKANPTFTITLTGHSDASEVELAQKKEFYKDIDMRRAEEVKKYLLTKGIAANRIQTKGAGAANDNTTEIKEIDDKELKLAKNRRVEVKVN